MGEFDVLVGINLLREGLDLPEVSLVSILDADKEGFLRSRHVADPDDRPRRPQRVGAGAHVRRHDHAVDGATRSTRPTAARAKQIAYNTRARHRSPAAAQAHCRHHRHAGPRGGRHRRDAGGTPAGPSPAASRPFAVAWRSAARPVVVSVVASHREWLAWARTPIGKLDIASDAPRRSWPTSSNSSATQMLGAARELQFEVAARLRDEIAELKKELRGMDAAGVR